MKANDLHARLYYNLTAGFYDLMIRLSASLDGVSPRTERQKLIDQLELAPGQRVLEVAAGTGSNLKIMVTQMGPAIQVVGLDLSARMLKQCRQKLSAQSAPPALVQANASRLPFRQDSFGAVLHFGGFNRFVGKKAVVDELMRVAQPAATIVISDKSLHLQQNFSIRQRILLKLNPYLASPPPVDLLSRAAPRVQVTWFWNGLAYILKFANPKR